MCQTLSIQPIIQTKQFEHNNGIAEDCANIHSHYGAVEQRLNGPGTIEIIQVASCFPAIKYYSCALLMFNSHHWHLDDSHQND
jgi:hypothetical protein